MPVDPPQFSFRCHLDRGQQVVTVAGEIDLATAPYLERGLESVLARADTDIVLDLAGVSYMEASGLTVLLAIRSRLFESKRRLWLYQPSRQVVRLLDLCRVGDLFPTVARTRPPRPHVAPFDGARVAPRIASTPAASG